MSDSLFLTGEQAASVLGISRRTLYRWMESGKLCANEWTTERLKQRRNELFTRLRPAPHCGKCGTREPARFSPHGLRPSGYAGYCRACNAERMRRARSGAGEAAGNRTNLSGVQRAGTNVARGNDERAPMTIDQRLLSELSTRGQTSFELAAETGYAD
jgi:hypothetical protein